MTGAQTLTLVWQALPKPSFTYQDLNIELNHLTYIPTKCLP